MSRVRGVLKPLLSAVIVLCTGYFFFRAFRRNWADVKAHEFHIAPLFVAGALVAAFATCLLATFAWFSAMNALSRSKIGVRQSIAAVNASSLTKYIPGKVWSYALQMYWLDGLGFSKALILYVNLINLLISLGTSLILGLLCLLVSHAGLPVRLILGALLGLLAIDACSILFNRALLNGLITLANKRMKRSFSYFEIKKSLLLKLHLIHLISGLTSGLGAYLFCFGIGYSIDLDRASLVIGASLVSDVAGFLAIVVPGGLGVREGLMYKILGGTATGTLSLVLPVASRMMNMFVDISLGAVALKLLRTLAATRRAEGSS